MTPADYLRFVVLPCLSDLIAEPDSQRRAYVACITAAHLVDHVDVAHGSPVEGKHTTREAVRAVGPYSASCLAIVEAVSNGTKHAKPDDGKNRPVKFAPGHERLAPALSLDVTGAGLDEGRIGASGIYVDHGSAHWFLDDCVVATVRAYAVAFPVLFSSVNLGPIVAHLARLTALDGIPSSGAGGTP